LGGKVLRCALVTVERKADIRNRLANALRCPKREKEVRLTGRGGRMAEVPPAARNCSPQKRDTSGEEGAAGRKQRNAILIVL